MKNPSPNSLRPNRKPVPNFGQCVGSKQGCGSPWNEMDHNLSFSGPILVIQKPNIKFTDAAKISMRNLSPNSLCFPTEN